MSTVLDCYVKKNDVYFPGSPWHEAQNSKNCHVTTGRCIYAKYQHSAGSDKYEICMYKELYPFKLFIFDVEFCLIQGRNLMKNIKCRNLMKNMKCRNLMKNMKCRNLMKNIKCRNLMKNMKCRNLMKNIKCISCNCMIVIIV
jgi:hypothetical protein